MVGNYFFMTRNVVTVRGKIRGLSPCTQQLFVFTTNNIGFIDNPVLNMTTVRFNHFQKTKRTKPMTNPSRTRAPILTLVAAFLISACEPVETTAPVAAENTTTPTAAKAQSSPVSSADLATAAQLIAKAIDTSKNEVVGGVRLLGARSEGGTVIIEHKITRTYVYVEPSRARRQLRASVCGEDFTRTFVSGGGAFQFEFQPRSGGRRPEVVTISSC